MTAVYSVPVCKLLKIKFINGMVTNSPYSKKISNKHWLRGQISFPFSDMIIANSQAGLKAYNAPGKKSYVIYNGFDFKRLDNIQNKELIKKELNIRKEFVVGMVATFSTSKDYRTYFDAACLLLEKRSDVIFIAIGTDTDSDNSKKLIDKQYIEHFRLLGRKNNVESYINAMDICILSTYSEGISNAILEYMALGKPVVATAGGGTSELVIDKNTGFLVGRNDPKSLSEKIELLLSDPKLGTRMGGAGKMRVKQSFQLKEMTSKYYDFYKILLKN